MSNEQEQWAAKYKEVSEKPPEIGAILTTFSGDPVKLTAELKVGAPPFIFGRVHVPDLFGEPLGWYLRDANDRSYHGWRTVLLPRARVTLIQKLGLGELNSDGSESVILVKSLRVVRYSNSKQSILCEVHEYCEEKAEIVEPPLGTIDLTTDGATTSRTPCGDTEEKEHGETVAKMEEINTEVNRE